MFPNRSYVLFRKGELSAMEDTIWDKVLECAKWLSRNPNSFICMPRKIGYRMAMEKCAIFEKFTEQIEKENNNGEI